MQVSAYLLAALLALSPAAALCQNKEKTPAPPPRAATNEPSEREIAEFLHSLAQTTERGKAIYEYDQAAWHGTDAFLELRPDTSGLTHYICIKTLKGWKVLFPRWNATHTHLVVAYEAKEDRATHGYTARKHDPPTEPIEDLESMERALERAEADFVHPDRPYNSAVLPASEGSFYVYLYPGQTLDNIWPLGGDVRYKISPDGERILEKRLLHKTILDLEYKEGSTGGFHSHIFSSVPEDTDVFYVLNRVPHIPEYIVIKPDSVWRIQPDGTIDIEVPCVTSDDQLCKLKDNVRDLYEKSQQPAENDRQTSPPASNP